MGGLGGHFPRPRSFPLRMEARRWEQDREWTQVQHGTEKDERCRAKDCECNAGERWTVQVHCEEWDSPKANGPALPPAHRSWYFNWSLWDCMIDMDKNSSFNVRQTNGGNRACRTESLFPGRKTLFP
jgi:hypothetical protein